MKLIIKKGTTSKRIAIFVQDSSSTIGAALTGLSNASGGLTWYYWREDQGNVGATQVTLASSTLGTYTSGSFKEKDATNMPGWYELGIPDAALATGASWVGMHLKGATNMAPLPIEIELVDVDLFDGVRMGLTALPNAAAAASGGLPTFGTGTGQLNVTGGRADADVLRWSGTAVVTPDTAGYPKVTIKAGTGTGELNLSAGVNDANVTKWSGTAVATPDTAGYPKVTAKAGVGTGELNLTAGVIDANTTKWSGTAVATPDAAGYPKVTHKSGTAAGEINITSGVVDSNVVNWKGTAAAAVDTAGYPKVTVKSGAGAGEISLSSGSVTTGALAASAITASSIASDAPDKILRVAFGSVTTGGSTTLFTDTARAETTTDYWKGSVVRFTSGNNTGVMRKISAYSSSKQFTLDTATPASIATSDAYVILASSLAGSGATAGEVNTEVTNVIVAKKLDLVAGAAATNPLAGSLLDKLMNKDGSQTFDRTTDSLEAQRDATSTVSQTAQAVWDQLESGIATTGSIGLKLKSTHPTRLTKNTAFNNFEFVMIDSADHLSPKTGLGTFSAAVCQRSIDGGAFANLTNVASEVSNGVYKINLAAADLNGDSVTLKFTPTGADARYITILTQTG